MSEAIEFSIGGDNKAFTVVLKDTEQKAKETAKKVAVELDKATSMPKGKKLAISEGLQGVIGELAKVRTTADATGLVISRMGAGLKVAGLAVVANELVKGFSDATEKVTELREQLRELSRNSGGYQNISLVGMDAITQRIADLESFMKKNTPRGYGDVVSTFWGGIGSAASEQIMLRDRSSIGAFLSAPFDLRKIWDTAVNGSSDRGNESSSLLTRERKRLEAKYEEGVRISELRASGDTEGAEFAAIKQKFDEQLGMNPKMKTAIKRASEIERMAAEERNASSERGRVSAERFASLRARDAGAALGMSTQEEQRRANKLREDEAISKWSNLKEDSTARPGDKQLASAVLVAAKEIERIQSENAKWERDIARSKKDQLDLMDAQERATGLRMRGLEAEAAIVEKKARAEDASRKAIYEGNALIAERIRKQDELERKAERFARALDPETGRLRPAGERISEARRSRVIGRQREKSLARFEGQQGGGLLRVERNSRGDIISGIDPETGRRVNAAGDEIKRKVYGGAINTPVSLRPGGGSAADEIEGRQGMAATRAMIEKRNAEESQARQERVSAGKSSPEEALSTIAQILQGWDKGQ